MSKNKVKEFVPLKSTPRMWIIFIVYTLLISGITIWGITKLFDTWAEDSLATKVFTIEDDVVSLKLPDDWNIEKESDGNLITFKSGDQYESLSIASLPEKDLGTASIAFMLELNGMFPDVSGDMMAYSKTQMNGKNMYVTQIQYQNKYYLCGVMDSGNTIIKFVYSASVMSGEISDIDTIIGSINYRNK